MTRDAPDPWEPLEHESARAYKAFTAYRDLPPRQRSIYNAYRGTVKKPGALAPGQFNAWSSENHWVARSRAWDAHVDREARDDQVRRRVDADRQAAQIGSSLITVGLKALAKIRPEKLTATEAARLVELGRRIQREALGAIPVGESTDPDMDLMDQLIDQFRGAALAGDTRAADLLIKASERKAIADGTDQSRGIELHLAGLLGPSSPLDLSYETRQRVLAEASEVDEVIVEGD